MSAIDAKELMVFGGARQRRLISGEHGMSTRTPASVICIAFGLLASSCGTPSNESTGPTAVDRPGIVAPPTTGPDQTTCVAANAAWAIGSPANDELLEKARLAARAAVARFVVRGQPITTEYLGTRLNLEVDERQLVVAARCG